MDRIKTLETGLVLTTGFLLIYLLTKNDLFLYLAFAFGITGIFIQPLAKLIAKIWFKLADFLNLFVSKIILGTLYFVVLFPTSLLYKISNKDKLRLKRQKSSLWIVRDHTYSSGDLENIW